IQEEACQITKELLLKENLLSRVRLFCDNHQHLQEYITEPLKAAVFNLGYLPGSDEKIITKSDSTYQAVLSSLELLAAGGIVLIAAYPGHAGGEDEYLRLCQLLASIDGKVYQTASLKILNRKNAPVLLMINKL
ncbi:MAG: class I SAM-dependent methyltransferase, partial [Clostridiales bacterium]